MHFFWNIHIVACHYPTVSNFSFAFYILFNPYSRPNDEWIHLLQPSAPKFVLAVEIRRGVYYNCVGVPSPAQRILLISTSSHG